MTDRYDYIIIGAGSTGCVLANRLTADPDIRVLLLEAGPKDTSPFIKIPMGILVLMRSKWRNWLYQTAPEPQLNNRSLFWPRGKTLGGSSSVNAMVYIRGQKEDYDHWAALGNDGWAYKDVLPYFIKSEDNERGANDYHGVGGPLHVCTPRDTNPVSQCFVAAAEHVGLKQNDDFNGAEQEGLGIYQTTQKGGERWSVARGYLHPILDRENLTVLTEARATRLLMDGKRVTGVRYRTRQGEECEVSATRETLLCGGAINSPQLLLLSGIGPREEIEPHGIEVRHELPGVGHNLQDHLDYIVCHKCKHRATIGVAISYLPRLIVSIFRYLFKRRGLLTSNAAEAGGFAKSSPEVDRADLQFHFLPTGLKDHGRKLVYGYGMTIHVCDLHPRSRGQIRLNSADPMADARIEARYLSDPLDLKVLRNGIKLVRRIYTAPSFARYLGRETTPGADQLSDEAIDAAIRAEAETIYHPVGSCKMGNDEMAVVDNQLHVHGLTGLRVADASIMPTLLGGNTNAPCVMIGEKLADILLGNPPPAQRTDV